MSLTAAARTATPNRVDATTIRRALREAGLEQHVVRVTSGKLRTAVELDVAPSAGDDNPTTSAVVAVLRKLWNDSDERVTVVVPWSVSITRAGYYNTVPVAAELDVLAASGVHPGRVAELAEDSTHAERVAELEAVLPADEPLTVRVPALGNTRVRLAAPLGRDADGVRQVRVKADRLEARDVDGEYLPLRRIIGTPGATSLTADYVLDLLVALTDRREDRAAAARLVQARSLRSDPVVLAGLERLGRALSVALADEPVGGRPAPVRVSAELDRSEPATFDTTPATGPDVDDEPEEGFPHPSGFAHLFEVLQLVRERRRPFLELSDAQAEAAAILVERGELRRFLDGSEVWLELAD